MNVGLLIAKKKWWSLLV